MKSDGDLVSLSSYDTCEAGSGHVSHVSARVSVSGYFSPSSSPELGHSMVPCKQKNSAPTSPNSFISFKESDSNGNDIRKVDNILSDKKLSSPGHEGMQAEKTDVSMLTGQVAELQKSLSSLQEETDTTITKLRKELHDKATIVETLQQQIRMKMFMNLTQQKNPMIAALADLQGAQSPASGPGFGGLNEDMLASWRKNLEQSLMAGAGAGPGVFPWTQERPGARTPGSPNTQRSETPATDRATPGFERFGLGERPEPGRGSPSDTETERMSPAARSEGSGSGGKSGEAGVSPTPSPLPPSFPGGQGLVQARSFANTVNTNTSSGSGSQLSIPPLFTSRIPKGDPLEERLHDMLRYNMEKFAGQPIDTLADSRRVRELLSVHNIGQRLFAKYVLGLSQGTVSELLSKPKSWDKLTEKGRDSYRKMHAWVWDDGAILLLKTLIPRKGELLRSSNNNPMKQDAERHAMEAERQAHHSTEHRINKILGEAKPEPSLSTSLPASLLLPSLPTAGGQLSAMSQLSGLAGPPPQLGGVNTDELKLAALSFYQNELSQLQSRAREESEPETENKEEHEESDRDSVKEEKEQLSEKESLGESLKSGPFSLLQAAKADHSFGLVRPSLPPGLFPGFTPGPENPLQRMASITNSLVSQPLPSPHFSQKPLKAVLPPITQQQFDQYAHLNSDDLTRRIKEILSQYSISQRLFGEAVLGLSQGSVSDLLARPKPWHMLTQKGREPFIRMKLFLEDETAIHKLVASQYKILPDKLLRTGAYSGAPMSPHTKLTTASPRMPSFGPGVPDPFRAMTESPVSSLSGLLGSAPRLPSQLLPGARPPLMPPHLTPNLYEVAALTQEFDTTVITNKVKELLLANNIGQKLFGEAVLGLSQGSVSELFSKPKPWHMLSIKGREPYIRMQLWLTDPNNIEKLLAMKKLQEETKKRKRTYDDSFSGKSSPSDISDLYSNPGQPGSPDTEAKKSRESAGLDLSFKRDDDDHETDTERDEANTNEEERNDDSDDGNVAKQSYQGGGGGRSRRKPAAPQWVNPFLSGDQETEAKEENGDSRTINGVCVVNFPGHRDNGDMETEAGE